MIMNFIEAMKHVGYHLLILITVALFVGLVGWLVFRSISYFFRPFGNPESSMTVGHKGGMGDATGAAFRLTKSSRREPLFKWDKKHDDELVHDQEHTFTQAIACLFYIACGTVIMVSLAFYLLCLPVVALVVGLIDHVVKYFTPEIDDDVEPEVVKPERDESKEHRADRELAEELERQRLAQMKVEWEWRKARMQQTADGRRLLGIIEVRPDTRRADELRAALLKSTSGKQAFMERCRMFCFVIVVLFVVLFLLNVTLISYFILY